MTDRRTEIESHAADYTSTSPAPYHLNDYTFSELGNAVNHFAKRAGHRVPGPKQVKDLTDAKNYLGMMEIKLKDRCKELGIDYTML